MTRDEIIKLAREAARKIERADCRPIVRIK